MRRIRQLACATASFGCSITMILYGMAPTPRSAMMLFALFDFFQSFNACKYSKHSAVGCDF